MSNEKISEKIKAKRMSLLERRGGVIKKAGNIIREIQNEHVEEEDGSIEYAEEDNCEISLEEYHIY